MNATVALLAALLLAASALLLVCAQPVRADAEHIGRASALFVNAADTGPDAALPRGDGPSIRRADGKRPFYRPSRPQSEQTACFFGRADAGALPTLRFTINTARRALYISTEHFIIPLGPQAPPR